MTLKKISYNIFFAAIGGLIAVFAFRFFMEQPQIQYIVQEPASVHFASYRNAPFSTPDFRIAAERTINAVVHVKTYINNESESNKDLFDFFFGNKSPRFFPDNRFASGSGVIVSSDGFIITNNHVIEQSGKIEVVLNDKRSFKAKLIGTDPDTDIALLKISGEALHYLNFGNSDSIHIGEWVIAVGNPFNLTSTVTAGIISAKGRNINILSKDNAIEAFIQTDAVVNPGNSGGALVDVSGNLIGINTAIASNTGYFTGYSFAVPSSIVEKVYEDIKEYGEVQRALLGVKIKDIDSYFAKEKSLDKIEGVYVTDVYDESAAKEAGIKKDDIITEIAGVMINSVSDLHSQISKFSPGHTIRITIKRGNKNIELTTTLKNRKGDTNIVIPELDQLLGARFSEITISEKEKYNIGGGVKVTEINAGKLLKKGVKKGFIITSINDESIKNINDLYLSLKKTRGGVIITGVYPNGEIEYYAFGMK